MNRPKEFENLAIILGVKINDQPMNWFLKAISRAVIGSEGLQCVFTPNPEICLKAADDEAYRSILNSAMANLPDGVGLKMGAKVLQEKLHNRVTGADLTVELMNLANDNHWKIGIVLRHDSLINNSELAKFIKEHYPQINFEIFVLDKPDFDADKLVLDKINFFAPALIFVCLGAPYQEKFLFNNRQHLSHVKVGLGVGGSFDFLTGKIKRAPKLVRDLGLEWTYRLLQEPQRLARIKNATAGFLLKCREWRERMNKDFRPNVMIIIKNNKNQLLIMKNARLKNHWQFPQGGVDENEDLLTAARREAGEELGIPVDTLVEPELLPIGNEYIWPDYAQKLRGYKGQKQRAVIFKFIGQDKDLHPDAGYEVEECTWVNKFELLSKLHPVRREFVAKIIDFL